MRRSQTRSPTPAGGATERLQAHDLLTLSCVLQTRLGPRVGPAPAPPEPPAENQAGHVTKPAYFGLLRMREDRAAEADIEGQREGRRLRDRGTRDGETVAPWDGRGGTDRVSSESSARVRVPLTRVPTGGSQLAPRELFFQIKA